MLGTTQLYLFSCVLSLLPRSASYDLVRDYSGATFFDRWDFYGSWDNLTLGAFVRRPEFCFLLSNPFSPLHIIGDVVWLDRVSAFQENLVYIDEHNRAIIKVDNIADVPWNEKRNSVFRHLSPHRANLKIRQQIRITSHDFYRVGSLWIIDLTHLPYGCSVGVSSHRVVSGQKKKLIIELWHRFGQHFGAKDHNGRIMAKSTSSKASTSWYSFSCSGVPMATWQCFDIKTQGANQYALHTVPGCSQTFGAWQTGVSGETDCSRPSGCFVTETSPNSFGEGFAMAGGGVWAAQFDVAGVLCV